MLTFLGKNISDAGWGSPKEALAGPNPLFSPDGDRIQRAGVSVWRVEVWTGGLASGSWVAPKRIYYLCLQVVQLSGERA